MATTKAVSKVPRKLVASGAPPGNRKSNAWDAFMKKPKGKPKVNPSWGKDPANRQHLIENVRAIKALSKTYLGITARATSPTKNNPVKLNQEGLDNMLAVGSIVKQLDDELRSRLKRALQSSDIGLWILEQKGLGAGWFGAYVLASFPDIYDAGICLECGRYLLRTKDMQFYHPTPPEKRDGSCSKYMCKHDGTFMDPENYRIHERKPSTFVKFAGLATVPGWECPACNIVLIKNYKKGHYAHPNVQKGSEGFTPCDHRGTKWNDNGKDVAPTLDKLKATATFISDKPVPGQPLCYNAELRAKLIGPGGIAEGFIRAKHPVYYALYLGYKKKKKIEYPKHADARIDKMAKRKIISQFIIDFFIKWRTLEGLPCRPSYAEEKLGIKHHP